MKRLNNLFRYTHILFNFKVSKPLRVKFCLVLSVPFVYIILKHGLLVKESIATMIKNKGTWLGSAIPMPLL